MLKKLPLVGLMIPDLQGAASAQSSGAALSLPPSLASTLTQHLSKAAKLIEAQTPLWSKPASTPAPAAPKAAKAEAATPAPTTSAAVAVPTSLPALPSDRVIPPGGHQRHTTSGARRDPTSPAYTSSGLPPSPSPGHQRPSPPPPSQSPSKRRSSNRWSKRAGPPRWSKRRCQQRGRHQYRAAAGRRQPGGQGHGLQQRRGADRNYALYYRHRHAGSPRRHRAQPRFAAHFSLRQPRHLARQRRAAEAAGRHSSLSSRTP